jgi:hypothetical protein
VNADPVKILSHIETARWVADSDCALQVSGWCVCPDATEIAAVEAFAGERRIAAATMIERPDVQAHHAACPSALRSGFTLKLPLVELETAIELRARRVDGAAPAFHSFRAGDRPGRGPVVVDYSTWRKRSEAHEPARAEKLVASLPPARSCPLVSLLLPVFNTPPRFLSECVESVRRQLYPHWELRIVDDASTDAETRNALRQLDGTDRRIHLETLPANAGISRATNRALATAQGTYVGFIDHDDRLHPLALAEIVARLIETGAEAVYTDEEKITADGRAHVPFLKPDFSPVFLRGVMYVGHFFCVRTATARAIGGFDPQFDGIQDFEFALRLSERTQAIEHVARILYQWRMSPSSSALTGNVKGDMDRLQADAVRRHCERIGRPAEVQSLGGHRVRSASLRAPAGEPCGVLVQSAADFDQRILPAGAEVMVLREKTGSELIRAVEALRSERVVWINEAVGSDSPAALTALFDLLDDPAVAAVAPVLLARDGKILTSGLIVTADGELVPAMRGFDAAGDGYNGSLVCDREVSAVASACVAFRKHDLLAVLRTGAVPFTDADMAKLCLTLRRQGRRIAIRAAAHVRIPRDWTGVRTVGKISPQDRPDPFYNRNFDALAGDYRLAADLA